MADEENDMKNRKRTNDIAEAVKFLQSPKKYQVHQIVHCLDGGESWTIVFKNGEKVNPEETKNVTILYDDGKMMSWGKDFLQWAPELIGE